MDNRVFIERPIVSSAIGTILFLLCFTSETFLVACLSTFVLAVCLYFRKSIQIAVMDIFVIGVLLWEIVITVFVSGAGNAGFLSKMYFFTIYYFILRLTLTDRAVTGNFLLLTSVIVTIISFICIVSFGMFREKVVSSGFESLYDFKYLYRPFGELNNVWASIFLSLTGLIISGVFFLDGKKRWFLLVPFVVLFYCLLVSFSRGVYISIALLMIILVGFIVTSKIKVLKKCLCVAGLLTVCLLLSLSNGSDVLRTIKMTETVSQQRSLDYRVDAFSYMLPAMKKSPAIGVGSGRYSMAVNEFIYENDIASITDFAPNIVSQLLLEKGIAGTLLWSLIYIAGFILSLRCRSKCSDSRLQLFIFMFLTVLLVREMTFPALLGEEKMLAVLAVFLALSQNNSIGKLCCVDGRKKWIVSLFIILPFVSVLVSRQAFVNNSIHLRTFVENMKKGNYIDAFEDVDRTIGLQISPLLKGAAAWHLFRESDKTEYLELTADQIEKARLMNPYDMHLVAFDAVVKYYGGDKKEALNILKNLAVRYQNNYGYCLLIANLMYMNGNRDQSVEYFADAVLSMPSILESEAWKRFTENDIEIKDGILGKVMMNIYNCCPSDPIILSKYGKLCYLVGDNATAKKYLVAASESLPNLQTPWVYLTRIAKEEDDFQVYSDLMRKLSLWDYDKDRLMTGQRRYTSDYNQNALAPDYSEYCLKLEIWYKVFLYGNIINFNID